MTATDPTRSGGYPAADGTVADVPPAPRGPAPGATVPTPAPPATPGETLDVDKLDLDEIERTWLVLCGSCDAGQPGYCTCPTGDHRAVIQRLAAEVRRLRSAVERARAERDFAQELRDQAATVREHDRLQAERAILRWAAERLDDPGETFTDHLAAAKLRAWADELDAAPAAALGVYQLPAEPPAGTEGEHVA